MNDERSSVQRPLLARLVQRALAERERLARRLVVGSVIAEPPAALAGLRKGNPGARASGPPVKSSGSRAGAESDRVE